MMLQSSSSPPPRPASSIKMDIFYTESLWTYADSFQPGEQTADLFVIFGISTLVDSDSQ